MAKKIALKLDYQSPFTVFSIFSTQKDYRLAWLLNENLGFELERIKDYTHLFSGTKSSWFPLFCFDYKQYRTLVILLGNKSAEGVIFDENPPPDYMLLLLRASEFINQKELLSKLRKIDQIQAVATPNEAVLKKHELFFYDLEHFLSEQAVV